MHERTRWRGLTGGASAIALAVGLCMAPGCAGEMADDAPGGDGIGGKADDGTGRSWSSANLLNATGLPDSEAGLRALCDGGPTRHTERVLCYFHDNAERGSFAGAPGNQGEPSIRIEYAHFPARGVERAALVVVTGRTESYIKYAELVYDLMEVNGDLGYSLYLIDHRGQGFSERLLKHDPEQDHDRGFVQEFDDYVTDLHTFMHQVVRPKEHARVLGLAHSMGGGITTRYIQQYPRDHGFDALVLTSPMHGIADVDGVEGGLGWAKERASLAFLREQMWTGRGWRYVPGGGPFDPEWGFFEDTEVGNSVTHSLNRHILINYLYRTIPEITLGSPTCRWVIKSHEATLEMQDPAESADVDLPILLLQAGQEQIVSNSKQRVVCDNLPDCTLEVVEGARHEPIFEIDSIRTPYLNRLVSFYESHLR